MNFFVEKLLALRDEYLKRVRNLIILEQRSTIVFILQ